MIEGFTSPPFSDAPILFGAALDSSVQIPKDPGNVGIIQTYDGTIIRQVVNQRGEDEFSDNLHRWSTELDASIVGEDIWRKLKELHRSKGKSTLIDWDREVLEILVAPSKTSYAPQRTIYLPHSPASAARAWLDGTEQTVVDSATPAAGEIGINGGSVHVPSGLDGSQVIVEFVAVYDVLVFSFSQNPQGFNNLTANVEFAEV